MGGEEPIGDRVPSQNADSARGATSGNAGQVAPRPPAAAFRNHCIRVFICPKLVDTQGIRQRLSTRVDHVALGESSRPSPDHLAGVQAISSWSSPKSTMSVKAPLRAATQLRRSTAGSSIDRDGRTPTDGRRGTRADSSDPIAEKGGFSTASWPRPCSSWAAGCWSVPCRQAESAAAPTYIPGRRAARAMISGSPRVGLPGGDMAHP
jgi:hypothetical protein